MGDKNCATKTAEYDVVVRTRAEELAALAETIKVLNDDDALDLFKKTLPSPTSSFMQVEAGSMVLKRKALAILRGAQHGGRHRAQFDLIALALTGKKISFGRVLKMIDDMISMLKDEQIGDNEKKA